MKLSYTETITKVFVKTTNSKIRQYVEVNEEFWNVALFLAETMEVSKGRTEIVKVFRYIIEYQLNVTSSIMIINAALEVKGKYFP